MNTVPKVSVGLPVKNGEDYVYEALESIRQQTLTDFEVVISDNASTDQTGEICRSFAASDSRFRYERLDRAVGIADNFNAVFRRARAPYFKWIAHDDRSAPTFLAKCLEEIERDRSLVLVHPAEREIDGSGNRLPLGRPRTRYSDSPSVCVRFRYLCFNSRCDELFGVIRTDVLRKTMLHGRYPSADRVLLAELALYGRFLKLPERLYIHREHEARAGLGGRKQYPRKQYLQGDFTPATPGKVPLPHCRMALEFARAIARSPLGAGERLCCYAQIARWMISTYRDFVDDIAFYGRRMTARN